MTTINIVRQNVDFNARKKDYAHLKADELAISSVFYTLQGEGMFSGYPAVFIRTAGCNFGAKDVACSWCDTSFALKDSTVRTIESLVTECLKIFPGDDQPIKRAAPSALIVITGGEPLLQPNAVDLIRALLASGFVVQVETNGTFMHRLSGLRDPNFHIVCSPKQVGGLFMSAPPSFEDYSYTPVAFKFVVSVDDEIHHQLPSWALNPPGLKSVTYVSPMTVYKKPYQGEVSSVWDAELVDQLATAANYMYAADLALRHKLRLSCQVHTFLAIA